ncbi:MAG TPA: hypothetical protein PLV92_29360, partial [Pirellulaceae bacterium]|nr:hypothetical protein [Pirellulaceae bacterium]
MSGVDAGDFALAGTTATLSVTTVSATQYDLAASGGNLASLNATVGLNFAASSSITDSAGNALPRTEPATDETFVVDNTAPAANSFARQSPASSPTNADSLVFRVTFSEAMTGVDATDFAASGTTASLTVTAVSTSQYDVTLSGGNLAGLDGTVGLNFSASAALSDLAGNALPAGEPPTDETYVVDNSAPATSSFARKTPTSANTNADTLVFRVTFNEGVGGVDLNDFTISGTTAALSVATVSATQYDITVSGGNLAGLNATVGLNFAASVSITDLAGNALPTTEPATDETYIVDNTIPTADIVDVSPDPRTTTVGIVTVNFSEAVTGVDIADFTLTRDGNSVSLSGLSVS